jgi:hypothetical protein
VAPLIRRPYFDTLSAKPLGKTIVTAGMFRHAVDDVERRPGLPRNPASEEKPGPVIGGEPLLRRFYIACQFLWVCFIHTSDCTPYIIVLTIMV